MDAEQASNWAAAQAVGVGEDLVPAALRHIDFLEAVDRRRWLYEGPLLDRAIRRYPRHLPDFSTTQEAFARVWYLLNYVDEWLAKKPYPTLLSSSRAR
jgi:hypothetical protein